MLVIFVGAVGGMVSSGITGLFVGAVLLALGYKVFLAWLDMQEIEPGHHSISRGKSFQSPSGRDEIRGKPALNHSRPTVKSDSGRIAQVSVEFSSVSVPGGTIDHAGGLYDVSPDLYQTACFLRWATDGSCLLYHMVLSLVAAYWTRHCRNSIRG